MDQFNSTGMTGVESASSSCTLYGMSALLLANSSSSLVPASPNYSFSSDAGRKLNSPLMKGRLTTDTKVVDLYEDIIHDCQEKLDIEKEATAEKALLALLLKQQQQQPRLSTTELVLRNKIVQAKLWRDVNKEFVEQAQLNANFLNLLDGQTRKSYSNKLKTDRLIDLKYNVRAVKRDIVRKSRIEADMTNFIFSPTEDGNGKNMSTNRRRVPNLSGSALQLKHNHEESHDFWAASVNATRPAADKAGSPNQELLLLMGDSLSTTADFAATAVIPDKSLITASSLRVTGKRAQSALGTRKQQLIQQQLQMVRKVLS